MNAFAGDTHIMYADWDEAGELTLQSIHQYGAATLDENSPHFSDQVPLFARGEYKRMPMTLEAVLPKATRRSKRSFIMTLSQALMKSVLNFSSAPFSA